MRHFDFTLRTFDGLELSGQGWEPINEPQAVVCLVHDLGEHIGRSTHLAPELCAAGFAVMGFDMRGHGQSGGPRGHAPFYSALLDDISRVLFAADERYPAKPRFLYGFGVGGNLVLNFALRCRPPLAGVIASSPSLKLLFELPSFKIKLGRLIDRFNPRYKQTVGLDTRGLSHDPEVARVYRHDKLIHNTVSVRLGLSLLEAGQWALDHAADFKHPLLLTHGGADRIASALATREFSRQVPSGCTLKVWEGLYHEIHNELQRDEVLAYNIGWLREHVPNAPLSLPIEGQAAAQPAAAVQETVRQLPVRFVIPQKRWSVAGLRH